MIKDRIQSAIQTSNAILNNDLLLEQIDSIINKIIECFNNNGKVYLCGNGGSAADAQHIAAELSGRFYLNRPPLPAEALHVNSSYITAVANDYSYDEIYSRYIQGMGNEGDILIGLSTSGNSTNIVKALQTANNKNMITVGFTGRTGGLIKDITHYLINIPSEDTPRIQEAHILVGHIITEKVESEIFRS